MKNKEGQSLIDVIFSIGIIVLVLTGVVVLIVSTSKTKRMASQRQKAIELSQLLIEDKLSEIKAAPAAFWLSSQNIFIPVQNGGEFGDEFAQYDYTEKQEECEDHITCKVIFIISWDGIDEKRQELTVERLFARNGI